MVTSHIADWISGTWAASLMLHNRGRGHFRFWNGCDTIQDGGRKRKCPLPLLWSIKLAAYPYWQAGNSLNQFKNGWGRLTIRCFSISFNVNFRHLRNVFGLGRPLSEDFTGVTTSSRRYLWRRHLGFKMAAPSMTSTKTWGGLFGPHWGGGAIWRPFRFHPPSWMTSFPGPENWEWGHPRWRPEAEGPPYCASASMGIEKAALYYSQWYQTGK